MRPASTLLVGAGGGLGALARYELSLAVGGSVPPGFPVATLIINVTGAFALGVIVTLVLEYWPPTRYVRPFFAIGVLGGYTTFSTFAVEAIRLIQAHEPGRATTYVLASIVSGLLAVYAGAVAARVWPAVERLWARGDG